MGNANLLCAKSAKFDEFYTTEGVIEKEVAAYPEGSFKGKRVLCNCDDPARSAFWRYFKDNFKALGLKRLVASSYRKGGRGLVAEYGQLPRPEGRSLTWRYP